MVAITGGDPERLGRLREINAWFPTAKGLNDAAAAARGKMDDDELLRFFPNYAAQSAMVVLLWAMLEADSLDPERRFKWRVFRSLRYRRILPPMAQVEVVMGLPAPGTQAAPIEIIDEEEEAPRRKKKKEVTSLTSLPAALRQATSPLPRPVGISPAGNRFWLLARVDSKDEGRNRHRLLLV